MDRNATQHGRKHVIAKPGRLLQKNFLPVALLIVALLTALLAFVYETRLKQEVVKETHAQLESTARVVRHQFEDEIDNYKKNLLFLLETPPVTGMARADQNGGIDPFDGTTFNQWIDRLNTIFYAQLKNYEWIDQARVIRADSDGHEIVRVDRLSGEVRILPPEQLQSKQSASYFEPSAHLKARQLYISSIDLNREYGQIEYPFRPTIRLAAPVFYPDGERFGFVILNVNATTLLNELRNGLQPGQYAFLANGRGIIIDHPRDKYRFSADIGSATRLQDLYAGSRLESGAIQHATDNDTGKPVFLFEERVRTSSDPSTGDFFITTVLPESRIHQIMIDRRFTTYGFVSIVIGILLIVLLSYHWRIKSNLAIAETRSEFAAIVNGSTDAIIGMDLKGNITSWNDRAHVMLGFAASTAIGRSLYDLGIFDHQVINQSLLAIRKGQTLKSQELLAKTRDEAHLPVSVNISPIQLDTGEISGIAALIRDISEQKAAEEKVHRINEHLEQQVAERTEELEVAHQEAIRSSELKSLFISTVSHEMRTPLNGIMGTLNLIKREPLSPSQQKYLDMTESSTGSLAALINDILDLSKIEAGKLEFEHVQFDVHALLESLANSQAVRAQEKGLEFVLDASGVLHDDVVGDPNRLRQILVNLTSNALKFTGAGHVVLRAETHIEKDGEVVLSCEVSDTGIGIAKSFHDSLFQAFSQANSGVAGKYGGTGLGLSICKQLCDLMGGDIGFRSVEGQGSTFHFSVRLLDCGVKTLNYGHCLSGKSVALVLRNDAVLDAADKLLQSMGADVQSAANLMSALSPTATALPVPKKPDVLLLDRLHPDFDVVVERLEEMQSQDAMDNILTIVLRTPFEMAPPASLQRMASLPKPLTRTSLLSALDIDAEHANGPVHSSAAPLKDLPADISGRVVLIVDDSEINLEVARGILAPLQMEIVFASNGRMAIDILQQSAQSGKYVDCVLMDCQMPDMDGYEATRNIRRGDAGTDYESVPIIAMTASAMSGERERCIGAGMNDYITKPVDMNELTEKVLSWLSIHRAQEGTRMPPAPPTGSPEKTFSHLTSEYRHLPILDHDEVLVRLMNDQALVDRITTLFMNTAPDKMADLKTAFTSSDRNIIVQKCHALKGAVSQIGGTRLGKVLDDLEIIAADAEWEHIAMLTAAIDDIFSELMETLYLQYPASQV